MKKALLLIALCACFLLPLKAQEFIGCRTDSGWAETPMMRKHFTLETLGKGDIYVWVTSLGYHEVYINGVKVGDRVMQPAVSQLNKTVLQVGYNIKEYLREDDNEIMLWIGQGWGRVYGTPAVVQAEIKTFDEKGMPQSPFLTTDTTWEASPSGYSYTGSWLPLQFGGERFDARVEPQWRPASIFKADNIHLAMQEFEGNRIVDTLEVQTGQRLPDGSTILDFGRVVTGWYQVIFRNLTAGQVVTIEYLDHLDATPPHTETDIYISRGSVKAAETFTNRFHTHTFRYVRMKGCDNALSYSRALQISAVNPKGGATFECSDARLNAIHDMVKYTLSCLTFSGYMVDCPHLERMGYGGDGNSSTMTLQTLWDVRDTYRNWLSAWHDAIEPDGELPYVAPAYRTGGGPYWSGFLVKAPWRTYLNYGDSSLIVLYYNDMCRWLEFIRQHCEDEILQPWPDNERHTWFLGDWLAPEGVDIQGESVLHVNSCFISECLGDMVQMASMIHREDDARHFLAWRGRLNKAIHRHFYHPETHTYANGTPLDQAYALLLGIPGDADVLVRQRLLDDCHGKYRDHIAVGLVGVPVFTEWCIRERQTDFMATLLRQPDYPGYLHMITDSATTTWESWDGHRSHVHNCYNGIGIWFYQALAGIRPDPEHPGYKHFFIDPQPCEGIDWVRCTKPTPYGDIHVDIEKEKIKVIIPNGTTATLFPGTPHERTLQPGEWTLSMAY